jgi:hypothetical protein
MAEEKAQDKAESKTEAKAEAKKPADAKCRAPKCKQLVRAKGYCRKHFIAWRRGEVGGKHRYKICSKEGCRKKRVQGGRCEEHAHKSKSASGAAS